MGLLCPRYLIAGAESRGWILIHQFETSHEITSKQQTQPSQSGQWSAFLEVDILLFYSLKNVALTQVLQKVS